MGGSTQQVTVHWLLWRHGRVILLMAHFLEVAISLYHYLSILPLLPFPSSFHPGETSSTCSSKTVWKVKGAPNYSIHILLPSISVGLYVLFSNLIWSFSKILHWQTHWEKSSLIPQSSLSKHLSSVVFWPYLLSSQSSFTMEHWSLWISRGHCWFHWREASSMLVSFSSTYAENSWGYRNKFSANLFGDFEQTAENGCRPSKTGNWIFGFQP